MGEPLYPLLASPVELGPMKLRNRVVLEPHGLCYAQWADPRPTRRHLEYYRARARGGAALVCMESSVCSLDGQSGPLILSSDPGCVEGYRAIAEAVHVEGALICGQITHYGHQANLSVTRRPPLSPSAIPDPLLRQPAHPMDSGDMARVRDDFVASARHFVAAGFDAVELKLAHDGLLRHFMSPLTNDRGDEYGGSTENRLRYPLEVIEAVRAAIGPDIALSIRLVVDEHLDGGYDLDEGITFAELLAASGFVDYLNSDVGTTASMYMIVPPMGIPEGYAEPAFARMSEAVDLPVIACGQISSPEYAEKILAEGKAQAVGMARQLLAEPDWVLKALSGRAEQIRPCTRCNQLCVDHAVKFLPISCTVNPLAGYGERLPQVEAEARRLTVVGGGPAGMEAARVAAEDGHSVTLFEAGERLGGQLALAAETGGRDGWGRYLAWLERELERLEVTVRTGERATADDVLATAPDSVVIATGSAPGRAAITSDSMISLDEFITGRPDLERIAFVDFGAAGAPLWTAALEAAIRGGGEVALVTPLPAVACDLDFATFTWLGKQLAEHRVRALTQHVVTAADRTGFAAVSTFSGEETRVETDVIVASTPRVSVTGGLERSLGDTPVTVIGDAYAPRDAAAAIREGQDAGAAISRPPAVGPVIARISYL